MEFNFSDQPASKRMWWLVNDHGDVDLCATNPGFGVALFVTTNLRTMCRVWLGDLAVREAINSSQIQLDGPRELRQRFEQWLGLSGFAAIKDGRRETTNPSRSSSSRPETSRRPV